MNRLNGWINEIKSSLQCVIVVNFMLHCDRWDKLHTHWDLEMRFVVLVHSEIKLYLGQNCNAKLALQN